MPVWKARCVRPIRAKHNRREQGVRVPLQSWFLKFISSYGVLLLWVGGLGRKEGRKESKNLCFILGSHTPESLFAYFVPAHLCVVSPVYVLRLSRSKPWVFLEGEFCSPVSHSSSIPAARSVSSSFPPVPTSLDLSPNRISSTYLAEAFFYWVSELSWCRASSDRQGRERASWFKQHPFSLE